VEPIFGVIEKPIDIIDRDAEWRQLKDAWTSARSELVFVVGRRRIGKSYLLARFAQAVGGIYYQATRRTEAEQLAGLSRTLGQHYGDDALRRGSGFSDWEALFGYLLDRAQGKPCLLILDEFPYLTDAAQALPSVIQQLWDHELDNGRFKLVLSGSYVTAMERLEAADQPLYGRRTAKLAIGPFGVPEAAQFVPNWSARDQVTAYGLFGHLPGHLALLDPARTLAQNVVTHCLNPTGRLVDDAQHTLDAFAAEPAVHYSILEAIASGETTWRGITSRVGRSGGALSRPLKWLGDMGLVKRRAKITEPRPDRSRQVNYSIVDPYLVFWYRIVAPLVHAGSVGMVDPQALWTEVVAPKIDNHMGAVFEQVCRDFIAGEASKPSPELPFRPMRVGSWWDDATQDEVDVVAIGPNGELLVGEAKWGSVTQQHLTTLRKRAEIIQAKLKLTTDPVLVLFTGRGQADKIVLDEVAAGRVVLHGVDDLVSVRPPAQNIHPP